MYKREHYSNWKRKLLADPERLNNYRSKSKLSYKKYRLNKYRELAEYDKRRYEIIKQSPERLARRRELERARYHRYRLEQKERKALYYQREKSKIERRVHLYRKEHPEMRRICSANRRAREVATMDGTVTVEAITRLLIKQGYKCLICSINIKDRTLRHLDHIKPISRGGEHTIKNVQWLCKKCNQSKGNSI